MALTVCKKRKMAIYMLKTRIHPKLLMMGTPGGRGVELGEKGVLWQILKLPLQQPSPLLLCSQKLSC